jgi:hypothetical protein
MLASTTRTTLSVLALTLLYLGPAAPPAHAQVLPRPLIKNLIKFRTKQAFDVDGEIQKTQKFLAQLPAGSPAAATVQTVISQEQALLGKIQTQINLLTQLLANLDAADAVFDLIQKTQKQINKTKKQAVKTALQALLSALQADLAQIQANINVLQAQIVV